MEFDILRTGIERGQSIGSITIVDNARDENYNCD